MVTLLQDCSSPGPPLPLPRSVERRRFAEKPQRFTSPLLLQHSSLNNSASRSEFPTTAVSPTSAFSFLRNKKAEDYPSSDRSTHQNHLDPSTNSLKSINNTRLTGEGATRALPAPWLKMEPPNMSSSHHGGGWSSSATKTQTYPGDSSLVASFSSPFHAGGHDHSDPHRPQQLPSFPPPAGYSWVLASTHGGEHSIAQHEQILAHCPVNGTLSGEGSGICERPFLSRSFHPENMEKEEEGNYYAEEDSAAQAPGGRRNMNYAEVQQRTTQQKRKTEEESPPQAQRAPKTK